MPASTGVCPIIRQQRLVSCLRTVAWVLHTLANACMHVQEASTWEPADLLPSRIAAGRPQAAAVDVPEATGGRETRPSPSLRSPPPRVDSQCRSANAEEHVAKLVLEAREADECGLPLPCHRCPGHHCYCR